jgi:PhnB protein
MIMSDAATTTRPHADVMRGVIPYLNLAGRAAEAADFYARAFAAVDLGRMPDPERPGRHMHVQIEINGGALMMTDHGCEGAATAPPLASGHLQLVVGDGKAWWDRAIASGCTVVMPYERQQWGDDWGLLRDPFGIQWAVLQPGPEQGTRA